jgi:recombination protein RecA
MMFAGKSMGISREGDIIDLGIEKGIISKQGAFINYSSQRLGQGRENAKEFLRNNPELAQKIEAEIRRKADAALPAVAPAPEEPPEPE